MSAGGGHGGDGELPGLGKLHHALESSNEGAGFILPGYIIIVMYLALCAFIAANAPVQSALNWDMVFLLGPVWLPIVIGRFALMRFINMRQMNFNMRNPFVLLEMRVPREIYKTPRAMESVFAGINLRPGTGTWFKRYWWGRTRPWWSFELVSIGGEIHFYVYVRENMRRVTESALYGQFPDMEIIEATDYSRLRNPTQFDTYQLFACEYTCKLPDPYPIRTYVDHELDRPGDKPETVADPFAQVLELMSSLGPDEQLWTQFIIRHSKEEKYRGRLNKDGKGYTWRDLSEEIVKELKEKSINKRQEIGEDGAIHEVSGFPNPTEAQKELIAAVERNTGKAGFDVGIRSIYSAPKEKYYGTMNAFTANIFKPYVSERFNQIVPAPLWDEKFNDYPWEDIGGYRRKAEMKEVLEFYRARSYFHPPYRGPWMILSSEELATIYHFPNSEAKAPGVRRIGSATSAAPINLPQ